MSLNWLACIAIMPFPLVAVGKAYMLLHPSHSYMYIQCTTAHSNMLYTANSNAITTAAMVITALLVEDFVRKYIMHP